MKVFISWSGDQSRALAQALRQWLPDVLQAVQPWMSATDIGAGARWNREIDRELSQTTFGILCLTADNLAAPWLLFEAGALAKTIEQARVCPYLLGIDPTDIPSGPLTQFQAKRANRAETLEILQAVNAALAEHALAADSLERTFDVWWPSLEQKIEDATKIQAPTAGSRPVPEVLAEVLDEVRSISRRLPSVSAKASVSEQQRVQIDRLSYVTRLVNAHEDMVREGLRSTRASFSQDEITLQEKTNDGMLEARVRVKDWPRLDDEALAREVVVPLVRGLLASQSTLRSSTDSSPPTA